MDTSIVTALAGIIGTLCGGSASVATAWVTHKARAKREELRAEHDKRETLYGEFIEECSKRLMDSLERNLEKPESLFPTYALLNRIRLCASDKVLEEAVALVRLILDQYFAPNVSLQEFHEQVHQGKVDPLKAFSDACRRELISMHGAI